MTKIGNKNVKRLMYTFLKLMAAKEVEIPLYEFLHDQCIKRYALAKIAEKRFLNVTTLMLLSYI